MDVASLRCARGHGNGAVVAAHFLTSMIKYYTDVFTLNDNTIAIV